MLLSYWLGTVTIYLFFLEIQLWNGDSWIFSSVFFRAVKGLELAETHQVELRCSDIVDSGPFIFSPFASMSHEAKVPGKIGEFEVISDSTYRYGKNIVI